MTSLAAFYSSLEYSKLSFLTRGSQFIGAIFQCCRSFEIFLVSDNIECPWTKSSDIINSYRTKIFLCFHLELNPIFR
ncbi:hypothetical protein PsorP6_011339 [Peronosclerospora sorghi]|uniref:Uncharacterized protein n=1 Tax=Peronosclerospora sorghi TaxID=230839 RepID=A0ACC0WIV3_9STRA|nr:hypothetical protein PsorP6_011339 [Peronosclerospora sorghi]